MSMETKARALGWFPTREAHVMFRNGSKAGVCRHLRAGETYNEETDSLMSSPLRHADNWAGALRMESEQVAA